jgi:ABC-2 type transport system ATP-binding protein
MIEAQHITKRYGEKLAVDDLSFTVKPGIVTGFLGPNGAGKSTAMRLIIGLDAPTRGHVTVNGKAYREHAAPLHEVGTMLEARAIHTGRSARNHLLALAQTHGIPGRRVDEVIDLVGLQEVARKRVGSFSLGMGQRLGIASALLGDPETLILDEPVNGLDPEGIRWIRNLLRNLAEEGRTILVSSHLMSEMSLMADQLIVVGRGRLIADTTVDDFIRQASSDVVRVRTPRPAELAMVLAADGVTVISGKEQAVLEVRGLRADQIGEIASEHGIALHELTPEQASLEEAFMRLTHDAVEFHASEVPARGTEHAGAAA